MPRLSGSINHLCKEQWLCVKGGLCSGGRRERERENEREREGAVRCVSGTGGQGQSLSHLGSSSPSALDRLTCIHPPAQEGPRAHRHSVGVSPTHSHALTHTHVVTHAHSQTPVSSENCCKLLALPRGNTPTMLMHASSSI